MKLGIINGWAESCFQYVSSRKLEFIEWCVNNRKDIENINNDIENIKGYIAKYNMPIASIGSWGHNRIDPETGDINKVEFDYDAQLVDICEKVGCPVFVTGVNYVKDMTLLDNCNAAVKYLKAIVEYAAAKGIKVAVYNCDWNNYVCEPKIWDLVLPNVPGLGIKYDTSHCRNRRGDYIDEAVRYGDKFYHVHIKGHLRVKGEGYDDAPAGLDDTNWPAFMDVLYTKNYDGGLSIEPHSNYWKGLKGQWGVDYTINFMRNLIMPADYTEESTTYMPSGN